MTRLLLRCISMPRLISSQLTKTFNSNPPITLFANTAGGYSRIKPFQNTKFTSCRQSSKMKTVALYCAALSLLQLASGQPHRRNPASILIEETLLIYNRTSYSSTRKRKEGYRNCRADLGRRSNHGAPDCCHC